MRSVLNVAVGAAAVAAVVAGCGGHNAERRDAVDAYIRSVNRLENRSLPAFRRADEAMRAFATSRAAAIDVGRLRAGAAATESAGAALRRITPPREAAGIHRDLLRLFEREAALTREVGSMSAFLTTAKRLLGNTRPLRRGAVTADDLAQYSRRLRRTAAALDAAAPPAVLVPWRNDEVEWLRSLDREAARLARALRVNDAHAARVIAVRFRLIAADAPGVTGAHRQALIRYNARAKAVQDLRAQIANELAALDKTLR